MTFQGQITAASPLALAIPVTFNPAKFRTTVTYNDGSAVEAVFEALDEMPAEVRESTLEEIAVREKARELIEAAEQSLSPAFHRAFLRWWEAGSHFATECAADAEAIARLHVFNEAGRAIEALAVQTSQDAALVGYLAVLDLVNDGCFGPREIDEGYAELQRAIKPLKAASATVALTQELSDLAWRVSRSRAAWDERLGAIVTGEFSYARGELSAAETAAPAPIARDLLDRRNALLAEYDKVGGRSQQEAPEEQVLWAELRAVEESIFNAPATPDAMFAKFMLAAHLSTEGHELVGEYTHRLLKEAQQVLENWPRRNPYMRGPLINWTRAYERYSEVQAEVLAYQRDVIAPADAKFHATRARWPENFDFSTDAAASAEMKAADYVDEETRMDELYDHAADALRQVLRLPAGSPGQLATKLQLAVNDRAWETPCGRDVMRQLTVDARRFAGLGAYLKTDEQLLTAYAGCRREMALFQAEGCGTNEEDAAADGRVAAHEGVIWTSPATTTEGVLAKLRIAFQHLVCEQWSDHSIVDPRHPDFRAGLAKTGGNEQLLWSAIEDLARISGVNLSEQGA